MRKLITHWTLFKIARAFFPLQLVIAQLKYNLFSLLFWLVLFLLITDNFGYSFGVPLLFLSPEYLGEVSAWSFLLLGFSIGGFTMGFNTYSYMRLGPRFPFLTSVANPFFKFCINNSTIPFAFIILFMVRITSFQYNEELQSVGSILMYLFSFISGITLFVLISFFYFFRVSPKIEQEQDSEPVSSFLYKPDNWYEEFKDKQAKRYLYFGKWLRIRLSRNTEHFDQDTVEKVFAKNRINASIFEIATISMFFILGAFSDFEAFEVPAAVSIVLLITICFMLFSALHSWFKGWVYPLLVIVILGMDVMSKTIGAFQYTNFAYGLDYSKKELDPYTIDRIKETTNNDSLIVATKEAYIETLENWKAQTGEEKPKLIIVNTSGGGSRSALWTMIVMQQTDVFLERNFSKHTQLITGASGGMIGAAYYRELLLRESLGEIEDVNDHKYQDCISKDLLNKLSFSASTNDIFFRYQTIEYGGHSYTKDRGYAFETQLHNNTNHLMEHPLGYYAQYEKAGSIPTMIFNPTIINDGRRLLISSQNLNFLTEQPNNVNTNENIDIHSLLQHQDVNQMRFSSVLRSNATFPFVMPMVTLPTTPEIQLMDAGIRDNYGVKTMMELLSCVKDWIAENTSGVIVVQIRDTKKILDNERYDAVSFLDKITLPFGNMYKNFPRVQDFNQDELIQLGLPSLDFPVDIISFNLREKREDRISLSWHLTKEEKMRIENAFQSDRNQAALAQLKRLL